MNDTCKREISKSKEKSESLKLSCREDKLKSGFPRTLS